MVSVRASSPSLHGSHFFHWESPSVTDFELQWATNMGEQNSVAFPTNGTFHRSGALPEKWSDPFPEAQKPLLCLSPSFPQPRGHCCWRRHASPPPCRNSHPSALGMGLLGARVLKQWLRLQKVVRSVLILYDWCPCERKLEATQALGKDDVEMWGWGG